MQARPIFMQPFCGVCFKAFVKRLLRIFDNLSLSSHTILLIGIIIVLEYQESCFLSSNPCIYINWNSWIWTKRIPSSPSTVPVKIYALTSEYEKLINFLDDGFDKFLMILVNRHDSSFRRARELAEWGIPRDTAFRYLSQFIAPNFWRG